MLSQSSGCLQELQLQEEAKLEFDLANLMVHCLELHSWLGQCLVFHIVANFGNDLFENVQLVNIRLDDEDLLEKRDQVDVRLNVHQSGQSTCSEMEK